MAKKSWADMTPTQKKIVVVTGLAEVALTTWCAKDLKQRPAAMVRGPKLLWGPLLSVQPVGPIAYLLVGRR
ncbi:PLDc N-terminal domain-containing protein [Nocardioides sp. J2M5]|uniref:PLDc N-terminal domain-containing protein n=1 Tax=Nocardioides palaemonis TaxID=2829810 RepID=UPI001BABC779|nr:PLDc N-terminal domain-containing protein [Nocardioides palaemonis]MBS2938841.1 PLDc N-terminal domain-containing protein [Nocardioides palaemonis]